MTYSNQNIASKLWVPGSNPGGITKKKQDFRSCFFVFILRFRAAGCEALAGCRYSATF